MLMIEVPEDQDVSEVQIMKFKVFIINFVTVFGVGPSLKSFRPLFSKRLIYSSNLICTSRGQIVDILCKLW